MFKTERGNNSTLKLAIISTGERRDRFSCSLCGKAFASRSRLKLHEDSHILTELQVIIGIFHD
jgi:hypothetical protein